MMARSTRTTDTQPDGTIRVGLTLLAEVAS